MHYELYVEQATVMQCGARLRRPMQARDYPAEKILFEIGSESMSSCSLGEEKIEETFFNRGNIGDGEIYKKEK